jgi:hypothetical protein
VGPSQDEYAQIVRANQAKFRAALIANDRAAAARLEAAYSRMTAAARRDFEEWQARADEAGLYAGDMARWPETDALVGRWEQAAGDFGRRLRGEAEAADLAGVKVGRGAGVSNLEALGVEFGRPSVQSLQQAIGFVDNPAWQLEINTIISGHAGGVGDLILAGVAEGKNPRQVAAEIRRYIGGVPLADALRISRTTQAYSMREASRAMYQANADVVLGWEWSSSLDGRTCLSCLAQHGKRFSLETPLGDHYNGRCAMIPITDLNAAPRSLTGEAYFKALPIEEQKKRMGGARWEAWQDGEFGFDDLSQPYESRTWGTMYHAPSLAQLRLDSWERSARPESFRPPAIEIRNKRNDPYFRFRDMRGDVGFTKVIPKGFTKAEFEIWEQLVLQDDEGLFYYEPELLKQRHSDLMLYIYQQGREDPDEGRVRREAGGLLAGYEELGIKLDNKTRRQLQNLAYGDALGEAYNIKDNRMAGVGGGGRKRGRGFMGSAEIDGANRLREARMSQEALGSVDRGNYGGNFDF